MLKLMTVLLTMLVLIFLPLAATAWTVDMPDVPEPAWILLLGCCLVGFSALTRRARK